MSVSSYISHVQNKATPQSQPIPGTNQVPNSAGGFAWAVDCWTRLDRFLILGHEGGSYYAGERALTLEAASCIQDCFNADPTRTIARIVEVSDKGLAPKNDPAIFALALLSKHREALDAMPKVCRIGTHLFQFVDAATKVRGWGSALKRAVAQWYTDREPDKLAYQVTKYQSRGSWSHHDVLHKCHANTTNQATRAVFEWAKSKKVLDNAPNYLGLYNQIQNMPRPTSGTFGEAGHKDIEKQLCQLIVDNRIDRELIPTEWLNSTAVWDALLNHMKLTAMIRSLAKMTSVGLLTPNSEAVKTVAGRLNQSYIQDSRVHPIALLMAGRQYGSGHGLKGSLSWTPVTKIVESLDDAFYLAFQNVEPTEKRFLIGLDISGSMDGGQVAGTPMSPREASCAMAMVTMRTEPWYECMAFTNTFEKTRLNSKMSLAEVTRESDLLSMRMGSTDCAMPMIWALNNKIPVDAFLVYTDSETWAGRTMHPSQALQEYRQKMGINAKLIVVGMVANDFTIADPNDPGMLDVVGFSTDVPQVMASFIRG
jgi:60 kDa SS-A/Ro ribonucleoprotein